MAPPSIICQIIQEAQMHHQTEFPSCEPKDNVPNAPDQLPQLLIRLAVDIRSTFARAHEQSFHSSLIPPTSQNLERLVKSSCNPPVTLPSPLLPQSSIFALSEP